MTYKPFYILLMEECEVLGGVELSISLWLKYQLTLFSLVKPNMVISSTETRRVKTIILQA